MINKRTADITKEDIDALILNKVAESRTIDYKEELSLGTDQEKKEFLADIISLSNTLGGDLVFGIREERIDGKPSGIPKEATGIAMDNADALKLKIESIIRDGIKPRIPAIEIKEISGFSKKSILLIRVSQSRRGPHMIVFKRESPFYARSTAGKYPMDFTEIRNSFEASGHVRDRMLQFRANRLEVIRENGAPQPLNSGAVAVIHVIPSSSIERDYEFDINLLQQHGNNIKPLYASGWNPRINFDGFMTYTHREEGEYVQMFTSGIVEFVSQGIVQQPSNRPDRIPQNLIPLQAFENSIFEGLNSVIKFYKAIEVFGPIYFLLTLLRVKGSLATTDMYRRSSSIDREELLLPDFRMETLDENTEEFLYPIFNSVWRAFGVPKSPSFDPVTKRLRR